MWTISRVDTGLRGRMHIDMPVMFNIIEPEVILEEQIKIEDWSLEN